MKTHTHHLFAVTATNGHVALQARVLVEDCHDWPNRYGMAARLAEQQWRDGYEDADWSDLRVTAVHYVGKAASVGMTAVQ